ncbi:MAG: FAD-dependent oxidoreductase [Desulfobacterales bacterium]|nr:FAD-dependent oxidoreductase [Desulfobacterales bacterium]
MEALDQESVVAPGDIREAPVSMTTTDSNLTGSWKFFKPEAAQRQAPCAAACPIHNRIPAVLAALGRKDYREALHELRRFNPLPAVTGRVCPNFCQEQCSRKKLDQEVRFGAIERYLGDFGLEVPYPAPERKRNERIAVLGSGPAGLAAAYYLASAGFEVTVKEKEKLAGGLLRYGIPAYRLPRDILDCEIGNLIDSMGIKIELGKQTKAADIPAFLQDFDFVFCAPGLWDSAVPEEFRGMENMEPGLELLKNLNQGAVPSAERFAVVGGGDVAVDVARSLIRCGKQVHIIYRRTFEEMPAYTDEKTQALEEGAVLWEKRLIGFIDPSQSGGLHLGLARAEKQTGKIRAGRIVEELEVDRVVPAVGQTAHMDIAGSERIFLGGDYSIGAATVVEAMATGQKAAEAILASVAPDLLKDRIPPERNLPAVEPAGVSLDFEPRRQRIEIQELDPESRKASFAEIRSGLGEKEVLEAASRCLDCGSCSGCGLCWFFCPDVSVTLEQHGEKTFPVFDLEHCKGCGLCAAVCPRGVIQLEEDV